MKPLLNQQNKDYFAGALMLIIGLGSAYQGHTYPVGTLSRMGPGFFPMALGVIMALLGIAIMIVHHRATPEEIEAAEHEKPLPPEWRGWACIIGSCVAFIVIAKYGGFLPATFAITFISAMGDRDNTVKNAFWLSVAMVIVCYLVFSFALKIPFPLFTWGGA